MWSVQLGGVAALAVAGVLVVPGADLTPPPASQPGDWVVVALVALAAAGMCWTRSRVGAVAMLGVIGFLIAGWFLLMGGVDLALTQLLVEVLTVTMAVLVLRRLPASFEIPGRARRAMGLVLAVTIGLAAGVATWALTGSRETTRAAEFFMEEAESQTGGTNVVNTILVDFRGLDTFGEIMVLAVAGVGLLALLRANAPADERRRQMDLPGDRTIMASTRRLLLPLVAVASVVLLWRGHDEPGGGFIAALVAGLAVVISRLPRGGTSGVLRPAPLLVAGVVTSVGAGLIGLLDGAFLRPVRGSVEIGGFYQSLTSSLIFDIGVFLLVLGMIVAALERLGRGAVPSDQGSSDVPEPTPETDSLDAQEASR